MAEQETVEQYLKRIFTTGYMVGNKHGYQRAVDESYPELLEGQTQVGKEVADTIDQLLGFQFKPVDPSQDFSG